MILDAARTIANKWKYPQPHDCYEDAAVLQQLRRTQDPARIVLSVAASDLRAIRVHEGAGLETVERYAQHTNGGVHDFVRMEMRVR